jgi:hypothetical protein
MGTNALKLDLVWVSVDLLSYLFTAKIARWLNLLKKERIALFFCLFYMGTVFEEVER